MNRRTFLSLAAAAGFSSCAGPSAPEGPKRIAVVTTTAPPSTAVGSGRSLRTSQTQNGPNTVSRSRTRPVSVPEM